MDCPSGLRLELSAALRREKGPLPTTGVIRLRRS